MGSSGSYRANVYLQIPSSKKEKNTLEEIEYLKSKNLKKQIILNVFENEEIVENQINLILDIIEKNSNGKIIVIVDDNNAKQFLILNNNLDESNKILEKYSDEFIFKIIQEIDCTNEDLEYLNIEVFEIIKPKIITKYFEYKICSVRESIYSGNDNSSFSNKYIDAPTLKLLNIPDTIICLSANGNDY